MINRQTITYSTLVVYFFSIMILIMVVFFKLFLSIIFGPFIDMLAMIGAFILSLLSSLLLIFLIKKSVIYKVIPILILITLCLIFFSPLRFDFSRKLYYQINKGRLHKIEAILSENPEIEEMSDLQRHHKNINEKSFSDKDIVKNKKQIQAKFGDYLKETHIDIDIIVQLRNLMDRSEIIEIRNYDKYLLCTIDGFIDNEFGVLKLKDGTLKEGDSIEPWGFRIVTLEEIGDGWYYWAAT